MTQPEADSSNSSDAIDALVRSYLDGEAANTDAGPLIARVRRDHPTNCHQTGADLALHHKRKRRPLGWSLVTVVVLIGALAGTWLADPFQASAANLLRNVLTEHAREVDRCYRVEFTPDPEFWDGQNQLDGPSQSVLWTRGDRFWAECTIGRIQLRVGRQADGTLWVSPSLAKGIRFLEGQSQLPDQIAMLCAINAMTLSSLVDDVLTDFELQRLSNQSDQLMTLRAELKPGRRHPFLSSAQLDIEPGSNLLVGLTLETVAEGRRRGTITFTLLDRTPQKDEQYNLLTHLQPGAEMELHRFGKGKVEEELNQQ